MDDDECTVGYKWGGRIKEDAVKLLETTPHDIDNKHHLTSSRFSLLSGLVSTMGSILASIWVVAAGTSKYTVHVCSTNLVQVYGPWKRPRTIAYVMMCVGESIKSISEHLKELGLAASKKDFAVCSRTLADDKRLRVSPSTVTSTESQTSDEDEEDTDDEA